MNTKSRIKEGKKGALFGIVGNLLLFAVKLFIGVVSGSYALISDALHTLSDALSSLVVFFGFIIISRPADEEHHYGHGDAEAITGFIVAIIIVLIGIEAGRGAYTRLLQNSIQEPGSIAVFGALISIAGNLIMTRVEANIGREIKSPSLLADSAHHASDALSSVVVLVGVVLARSGYAYLDPLTGFFVAAVIIKAGFDVGRHNIDMLMGMVPNPELAEEIGALALKLEEVEGVHSIKIHYIGVSANVQLHIEVDKTMKVIDADRLAHRVQAKIVSEIDDVGSVIVHVCPLKGEHIARDRG